MIILPYVNSKSKPFKSFHGGIQQERLIHKLASRAGAEGPLNKYFIDTTKNRTLNHQFYGKINHMGMPVVTLTEGIFGNLPSPDRPLVCLDYVANSFENSKSTFDNLMSLDPRVVGSCSKRDFNSAAGFIEGISENKMRVYRGWESVGQLHNKHLIEEILPVFLTNYVYPSQAEIKTVNDLMNVLIQFLRDLGRDCLFTFTSFVLSPRNPIHTTGLAVDLMQADPNDNATKIRMMDSDGFQNLVTVMNKSGFRCSLRSPWTMVADLSSNAMKSKMRDVGVESPEQMFEEYFIETYFLDEKRLIDFILEAYYTFLNKFRVIVKNKYCPNGSLDYTSRSYRDDLGKSGKELRAEMDERLILQVYLEARIKEAPDEVNSTFMNRILNLAHASAKKKNLTEGFKIANREMLNLDTRFLFLKGAEPPSYLTSPDSYDKLVQSEIKTGVGGSGMSPQNRQIQTGVGGSGIAPGGGSTGGSSGGY